MILAVGLSVILWCAYLGIAHHLDERLARWWVPLIKPRRWAGPTAFLISSAALLAYLGLALLGAGLAQVLGNRYWALVIIYPAMLAYTPFIYPAMPSRSTGYRDWRECLRAAGADVRVQRAVAWWTVLPSFLGLVVMIVGLFPIFLR